MSGQPQPPSVQLPPPQPQPFRFWLPYRSNAGSWRQQPRPMAAPSRPQPPGPPPPVHAEPAPPARAVEEDVPIQADSSDESDTIAVEALDSLRWRGAGTRQAVADLELTLSRSPPPATDTSGDGGRRSDDAKISISGFPRARLFDGTRAPYRREIEDGLKSLAGRETPPAPRPLDQGYRVITLAGHNVGASMVLGNVPSAAPMPRTDEREGSSSAWPPAVAANVNSNVQGVNNSTMEESTCNSGDPGVRVDIKNAHEKPAALAPSKEPPEKPKEPARTLPPQEKSRAASGSEAVPVPPRMKRCLRALMIEERKPKPTACRFQCVADHAPPPATATASDPGGKSAGEITR